MKIPICVFFLFLSASLFSQDSIRFTEYNVGASGCKVSLPNPPGPVELEYSPDSSKIYTIESVDSTYNTYYHFGALVVKLNGITANEDILVSYLDYLKTAFKIDSITGYLYDFHLETHTTAKGIADVWVDKDGDTWHIIGWEAENILIVLFVYGPGRYPSDNYDINNFWHSAKFPGD